MCSYLFLHVYKCKHICRCWWITYKWNFHFPGAAGLIISINRILTKMLMPYNVTMNTMIFFIISLVMVLMCCIAFHVLRRSKFARYHVSLCRSAGLADDQRTIIQSDHPEEVSLVSLHYTYFFSVRTICPFGILEINM